MEGLAEIYIKKLESEKNPGGILARFFSELFEVSVDRGDYILFNKLVKAYGKDEVFKAVLNVYDMGSLDLSRGYYPILAYFCKKSLDDKNTIVDRKLIDTNIISSKLEKIKRERWTYKNPFEEE
jgi:hypothetical protein